MKVNLKTVKDKIILSAWLGHNENYKIIKSKGIYSLTIYTKPVWVSGVTSMCGDNKHILLLDYDDTQFEVVMRDLDNLLLEGAGPFYIFTTKEHKKHGEVIGNYHVICPQKFNTHQIVELQGFTNCDLAYKTMPLRNPYRSWVLRIGEKGSRPKPKFLQIYGGIDKQVIQKEVSTAHLKLLYMLYPDIPPIRFALQDNLTKIFLNKYETINRVK